MTYAASGIGVLLGIAILAWILVPCIERLIAEPEDGA
jgi:hypothetical protein